MKLSLTLIAAVSRNGVIGVGGALPWRQSHDLVRFAKITRRAAVVMGRKTFESLPNLLAGRRMVVLTSRRGYRPAGMKEYDVEVIHTWDDVYGVTDGINTFVIGGTTVYRLAMPYATHLELTRIEAEVEGDAYFPHVSDHQWLKTNTSHRFAADARNQYPYRYETYHRRSGS